ncbi:MAG: hypothetical protein HY921_03120 [Elusimicrobia bacterium]|nr:hypothetical protein [Elusimicrobiota bacterium]
MESIFKKLRRFAAPAAMLAMAALSAGCLNNKIAVRQDDAQFAEHSDRLALGVGLYLDEETRNWVHTYKKMGVTYNFALGQALEASAPQALAKSFKQVEVLASPDGAAGSERIVAIRFGPATNWDFGPVVMAANRATVELLCEVRDGKGKTLWSGSAVGQVEKTAGKAAYLPGFNNSWLNKAYGRIFNEALSTALENLNNALLKERRTLAKR